MSHALGVLCTTHGWVMAPDACPECEERHGYTLAECDTRCPENPGYDIGNMAVVSPPRFPIRQVRNATDGAHASPGEKRSGQWGWGRSVSPGEWEPGCLHSTPGRRGPVRRSKASGPGVHTTLLRHPRTGLRDDGGASRDRF